MLRFFQNEKTNDNHYTLLINDLHQTAQDLQDAYRNLENVKNYETNHSYTKNPEDFYAKNPLEISES